ncbi:hypothetical protein QFZ81_006736 [Paenibacillus sp. V4I9]|nr:hypothetical protein [Paenibacillus sp. V4I9]
MASCAFLIVCFGMGDKRGFPHSHYSFNRQPQISISDDGFRLKTINLEQDWRNESTVMGLAYLCCKTFN